MLLGRGLSFMPGNPGWLPPSLVITHKACIPRGCVRIPKRPILLGINNI